MAMDLVDHITILGEDSDGVLKGAIVFRWNAIPAEGITIFSLYWQPAIGEWLNREWTGTLDMQDFQEKIELGLLNGLQHKNLPTIVTKNEENLLEAVQRRLKIAENAVAA